MTPNELRVGNIVKKGNVKYVADYLTIKMAHNYEPVPLTPEILEKAGFKKDRQDYYYIGNYELFEAKGIWFFASINEEEEGFKYVHQLQNLFYCLTGEELIINL